MSEILVENRQIVVPGQELAKGMDYLPSAGSYRRGESVIANKLGLVSIEGRAIKLIPLAGTYLPKVDDVIIAKVIDIAMSGWRVDTNSAYSAMLGLKEASDSFIEKGQNLAELIPIDSYIMCRVTQVTSQNLIDVAMRGPGLRKLPDGLIIKVNPFKVPRIIGKQGSMVSMIKEATGCNIMVGQNGIIWISGSPLGESIARKTIQAIEKFAHISGLTDTIKAYLDKECAGKDLPKAEPMEEAPVRTSTHRFDHRNGGHGHRRREGGLRSGGRRRFNDNGDRPPRPPRREFRKEE